ncbi:MAG: peptide chain release factor 2 [Chloroflexia bacterium]|nr:peptide chain release factor 2 [Chloroflexia bacterium]
MFDLPGKEEEFAQLEQRSLGPDFWQEPQQAQEDMRRLTRLREQLDHWHSLERQRAELQELLELAELDEEQSMVAEIEREARQLLRAVERLEFRLMMGGRYDDHDALLSIHAGAGGTEAQDWTEMLLRMYLRWAEQRDFKAEIIEMLHGEEAGIKTVTIELVGEYAYGYARAEAGVHRLVRLSPFDAAHRRHTSFALVEVVPVLDDEIEIEILAEDIRIDVFRAQGHGGQGVNTTDSAVRITHLPTGIVAVCQNERSQLRNKEIAMRVLRSRLYELELHKQEEELDRVKGEHISAGWGNQIRSYVLHPYSMVKDLRTGYETSNTTAVLDGDLDDFVEAYLRWRMQ